MDDEELEFEFDFSEHRPWDCSIEEYHSSTALSSTSLKRHLGISGGGDCDAAREGTAIHTFALEPEHEDTVISRPPTPTDGACAPRKKGCVEARAQWAAEWEAANAKPGTTVISRDSYDRARRRAAALSRFEIAAGVPLSRMIRRRDALVERSFLFSIYGMEGKRRIDLEVPGVVTIDVKSTFATKIEDFRRDVIDRAYDLQGAWNVDSGEPIHGRSKRFAFLAVNEDAEVAWIELSDASLSVGAERYRAALRLAKVARELQHAPPSHWSFGPHVLPDPAPWERSRIEEMAQYSKEIERWHKSRQQSPQETAAQ